LIRLQKILRVRGAAITETGNYQNMTAETVQQFQNARGLPVNGTADEATLHELTELPSDNSE